MASSTRAFTALARTGVLVADRTVRAQPVDVSDVAARVLATLRTGPSHRIDEFAGPEVLDLHTAARQWIAATGKRRAVLPIRVPGGLGKAFRAGHLTTEAHGLGERSWCDYLQRRTDPAVCRRMRHVQRRATCPKAMSAHPRRPGQRRIEILE